MASYQDALRFAQATFGAVDGVYAFSFGAVRMLAGVDLLNPNVNVWLDSPAPVPGTAGPRIGALRLASARKAIADTAGCFDAGCEHQTTSAIDGLLNGEAGISRPDAVLGLESLTVGAKENADFLQSVLRTVQDDGYLTREQEFSFRSAAQRFSMSSGLEAESGRLDAYQAGMCMAYTSWNHHTDPYSALVGHCSTNEAWPRADVLDQITGRITVSINRSDPVAPPKLQAEWSHYGRATHFSAGQHVAAPKRTADAAFAP